MKTPEIDAFNPPESFLLSLQEEALKINNQADILKNQFPERSYREITNTLIAEEMTTEFSTNEGTRLLTLPFKDFTSYHPSEAKPELQNKIIDYYMNYTDTLLSLTIDYKNVKNLNSDEVRQRFPLGNLASTNLKELESNFLSLIPQNIPGLIAKDLVPASFTPEDVYRLKPEQLTLVINAVLVEKSSYDYDLIEDPEMNKMANSLGLNELLMRGRGVCRHWAILASTLYEQIKRNEKIQNNAELKDQYNRTFLLYISDRSMSHAYNAPVKVLPNGDITVSFLDPTMLLGPSYFFTDFPNQVDFTRVYKTRLVKSDSSSAVPILSQVVPDFLQVNKIPTQPERDPLLILFEKYRHYTRNFDPSQFNTVEDSKDLIRTILQTPTFETVRKKYFTTLSLLSRIMGSNHYSTISSQEKAAIEGLTKELFSQADTLPKDGPLTREEDLQRLWNHQFDQDSISEWVKDSIESIEELATNPMLQETLLFLAEFMEQWTGSLIEGYRKQEGSNKQKASYLSKKTQDSLKAFMNLVKHPLQSSIFNFPKDDHTVSGVVKGFSPIETEHRPIDSLMKIATAEVYLHDSEEKVPFLKALQEKLNRVQTSTNEEIAKLVGDNTTLAVRETLLDEYIEGLSTFTHSVEGNEVSKKIVDVLMTDFNLEKTFGNQESLSLETMASQLSEMVTNTYNKLRTLMIEGEKYFSETEAQHIFRFLENFVSSGIPKHYLGFETFMQKQRPLITLLIVKYFESENYQYYNFITTLFKIIERKELLRLSVADSRLGPEYQLVLEKLIK